MFSVIHEATYASCLQCLQIGMVQKNSNQKGQDLDCMLGTRDVRISVFKYQQLLLPYEVEHHHDAKQLYLSTMLCIYCKQWVSTPLQA